MGFCVSWWAAIGAAPLKNQVATLATARTRAHFLGRLELDGGRCVMAQLPSALPHVGAGRAHVVRGALAVFISRGRGN